MAKREKQYGFSGQWFTKPGDSFGGDLLKSNPKIQRPIDTKLPLHLCLRSNYSTLRTYKNFGRVQNCLYETAAKYGVKIFRCANVGNHLHLSIRVTKRRLWAAFIRELTSKIAHISASHGPKAKKFWAHRPFTRIIRGWRKAYRALNEYIYLNNLEAEGHIDRRQVKTMKDLRAIFDG